jgi:tenascin
MPPVLESPRDLQFSDIGETSAKVKWVPPTSRVDSFKISYQLADGGEDPFPYPHDLLGSPLLPTTTPAHCLLSSCSQAPSMFAGEPQSVQVDGRTQTQILQGLIPDTRYEVTVVSVRGFEESEPLTGFLTTGKRDSPQHEER